jgi:hypothetical protein
LDRKGEEIRLAVGAERTLSAKTPAGKAWEVDAEIQGYWALGGILRPPAANGVAVGHLDLWPAGTLSGSLKMLDRGVAYPQELPLSFESPPATNRQQTIGKALVLCPVDLRGQWKCEVPAGVLDLTFRAKSFVPRYRWGLHVPAGQTLSLGRVELRKGASLSGWVEVEGGSILPGQCIARLGLQQGPGAGSPQTADRLRRALIEQPVGRDGFFQLEGIPPGAYWLEVQQPGYAPAQAFPLEVWDLSETSLKQPVVLRRPLTLELSLSPPLDWLGRPWTVSVQRRSDLSAGSEDKPAFHGPASREGVVRIAGQAPGVFTVEAADSLGNRFVRERDLEILDAESAKRSLEISVQDIQGKVTLGEEPLAATLWFGGPFGSQNVKLESGKDGKFRGVLPRGGTWRVQIAATNPKLETHLKVKVKDDRNRVAAVDLTLPDTRVFGKTVDESGHAVVGAQVDLADLIDVASTQSEEEGRFELRGVPEGNVELSARSGAREERLTSEPVVFSVSDGAPVGPMTLVLRQTKELRGKVRSRRGDVPGAFLRISPLRPPLGSAAQTRTGIDGSFSVRVDAKAEAVLVVVSPPGNALKAFSVPMTREPAALDVSEDGGDLDVALPFKLKDADREILLFQNGLPLPIPSLLLWTQGHGQRFETTPGFHVTALAAGEYEVCIGSPKITEEPVTVEARRQNARCAAGTLTNGSTLKLDLSKE